jgi:hypothetical protein
VDEARAGRGAEELDGPGTILAPRSTYWEVRASTGARFRIHVREPVEVAFDGDAFPRVEVVARHPLLARHDESHRALYVSGTPIDPRSVVQDVQRAIHVMSDGWRGLDDAARGIAGAESLLRAGHGLLMEAPESVCKAVAAVLVDAGVAASIIGSGSVSLDQPGHRALLLGRSYVIARAFAFERRP